MRVKEHQIAVLIGSERLDDGTYCPTIQIKSDEQVVTFTADHTCATIEDARAFAMSINKLFHSQPLKSQYDRNGKADQQQ